MRNRNTKIGTLKRLYDRHIYEFPKPPENMSNSKLQKEITRIREEYNDNER